MEFNYKEEIKKCINDLKSRDTFYKQIPNLLTVFRVVGIIPINILFFTGNIIPAIIVSLFVFISDFFDGKIARKYNIESEFGAKLDAFCDKMMFFGLSIPLAYNMPILIVNLLMEIGIGSVNFIKFIKGENPKTVMIGKVKTWLLFSTLGLGYLSLVLKIPKEIFYSLVGMTFGTQAVTLGKYLEKNKEITGIEIEDNDREELEIDRDIYECDYSYEMRKENTKSDNYIEMNKNNGKVRKRTRWNDKRGL